MRYALAIAALAAAAPGAHAVTVDGSNSPFTLNTPVTETVEVLDGATLIVTDGASVTPPTQTVGSGLNGVTATGSATVVVNGGAINGGASDNATASSSGAIAGTALVVNGTGDVTITGGEITGGAAFGPRRIPGDALDIDTTGTVTITGGEIRGGAQNGDGTRGGFVGNIRNAQVEISGGTFDGVFGRSSLGLIDVRNSTITGGAFNGGDEGFATDAFMTPTGEGDGLGVTGDSVLAIFDGLFTAGDSIARDGGGDALATSLRSNVTIFGGTFIGGLDMHSGERGDALSAVQNSVINVRGGTFLGTADLIQDAQLNIFGFADLLFDGTTVTGTLLSGDAINLDVRLLQNAQVNLNVIPLPAGAWLLLSGLAAMGAARRFRRA